MRQVTSAYGVGRVLDNAGRDKVKRMVDELKAKTLSQADADIVATEWGAYRGTWSGWLDEADAVAGHEDISADRFKFKSST